MATHIIRTNDTDNLIKLSVKIGNGHKSHTTVNLNQHLIADKEDSFEDFTIGTNKGLKNNSLIVTTTVLITSIIKNKTHVEFDLKGGIKDNHVDSDQEVNPGVTTDFHTAVYHFI